MIDRGSLMIVANKLLQLTNLDVPKPDPVAMILQSYMAGLKYREIRLGLELTFGYHLLPVVIPHGRGDNGDIVHLQFKLAVV